MHVEDMSHEFKTQVTQDLVKTVVAFANTSGGKIYIGVADSGEVLGIQDRDAEQLKLTNAVRDNILPDITPFTSCAYEMISGQVVIVYEVQKGTACPYYLKKKGIRPEGVYVRQGASSVPASQQAILKMIKEADGESFEELRSLNQDLSFETLKKEFDSSGIQLHKPQMRTLGIVGYDGLFTNLGLLLSDQCQHSIKAAVFEGSRKSKFKDRYEFDGSVIRQMRDVYRFVDRYNRTRSVVEGLERIDAREYPEQAIREALLNSIVHQDYAFGSSTLVSVLDDRLEILTVGGLPKGLTREDILLGTSVLRNKNLANVFYRLKWIEAYGTGIQKIYESYEDCEVQPVIETTDNAFKITLPTIQSSSRIKQPGYDLNPSEVKILELFESNYLIRRKDVEIELGISQPMAVRLLKGLLDKNRIDRIGKGKHVTYQVKTRKPY